MLSETGLRRLVIFQGILLVGGLVLVVVTIITRLFNPEEEPPAPPAAARVIAVPEAAGQGIAVPEGSTLEGYTSDGGILVLHLKSAGGRDRILVVDVREGRVRGDYELNPQ